jgi:hypothetical protein
VTQPAGKLVRDLLERGHDVAAVPC